MGSLFSLGWDDPDRRDDALERVLAAVVVHQPATALSIGELRVLRCFSHGLDRSQTAEVCAVGVETVKTQLRSARRKLAAKTTAQACCEAVRQRLIP